MKETKWMCRKRFEILVVCFMCVFVVANYTFFETKVSASEIQTVQPKTNKELAEERKKEKVASNERKNWPKGPIIGAEGACLLDADTGAILYDKNMDKELYPASVTKIMTCLLAVEKCDMKEKVKFSADAINSVPWDGANMGMQIGEKLTMEQCLNGVLVHSANEVANGVAEHIAGSMQKFADMMNQRAKELGCRHTHFVNANGLFDEQHYTSAHDLALIGRKFFAHKNLCEMASKNSYTVEKTNKRPQGFTVYSKNKFFNGQYTYNTVIGSKTGFTSEARQTLVSCAEQDGRKLICVILKEESPAQFEDTIQLFEYGFKQFKNYSIKKEGKIKKALENIELDENEYEIELEDNKAAFTLPKGIKPKKVKVKFKQTNEKIMKEGDKEKKIITGKLVYRYQNLVIGSAKVKKTVQTQLDEKKIEKRVEEQTTSFLKRVAQKTGAEERKVIVVAAAVGIFISVVIVCIVIYNITGKKRRR